MPRCYYEVLGVDKSVDDDTLRKAYRRLVVKTHPDKGGSDDAFQELQAAYETLSNAQERAWYDRHRDAIMRGFTGAAGGSAGVPDDVKINLWPFFSPDCYARADFFDVYADVFERLADFEVAAEPSLPRPPFFGKANADYEKVVRPFYWFWKSFSSRRSFAWADVYSDKGLDRYGRRQTERANAEYRKDARREYNIEIRSLVEFVYNRDPRISLARAMSAARDAASEKDRQERTRRAYRCIDCGKYYDSISQLRDHVSVAEHEAREPTEFDEALADLVAQYASTSDDDSDDEEEGSEDEQAAAAKRGSNDDNGDGDDDSNDDDGKHDAESSSDDPVFECVPCHKTFQSEGELKSHSSSRKHKQKVDAHVPAPSNTPSSSSKQPSSKQPPSKQPSNKATPSVVDSNSAGTDDAGVDGDDSDEELTCVACKRSFKSVGMARTHRNSAKHREMVSQLREKLLDEDRRAAAFASSLSASLAASASPVSSSRSSSSSATSSSPLSHGAMKKAKQAAKQGKAPPAGVLVCGKCNVEFESRNALMKHIESSGHALPR